MDSIFQRVSVEMEKLDNEQRKNAEKWEVYVEQTRIVKEEIVESANLIKARFNFL